MEKLDMTFNGGVAVRNSAKRKKRHYSRVPYKVKAMVFLVTIGFIFTLVLFMTRITRVDIEAGSHYSSNEVKNMVINDFWTKNSLFLFLKYRYQQQKNIPFVEYMDVDLVDKNRVKIVVYDKDIIGCIRYMGNVVYFDKDGYFVETSHEKQNNIPVVEGVNFTDITLHNKMKVDNKELFDIIMNLTQQISKYNLDIDEIYFDYTYDISLYSGDIEVLLGNSGNFNDKLAQLKNMLAQAKKEGLKGILHMETYDETHKNVVFDQKK